MKGEHSVRLLCEILAVRPSGYYRWAGGPRSVRQHDDALLSVQIATAHRRSRRTYGAPRLVEELRESGIRTSRRRCARLLREQGLRGRKGHRRKPRTTDSRHDHPIAPNRLAEQAPPTGPNQVWVADITYLRTAEGWLYLAAVLDLWSRRVVGWATAATLHTPLVLAALQHALDRRGAPGGLLHHSDRGSQYASAEHAQLLKTHGLVPSMSRAGNCYDNAFIESFWSTLKTETDLEDVLPASRRQAELAVFDYIETFYNPVRRHSALGYISPVAFENQQN